MLEHSDKRFYGRRIYINQSIGVLGSWTCSWRPCAGSSIMDEGGHGGAAGVLQAREEGVQS